MYTTPDTRAFILHSTPQYIKRKKEEEEENKQTNKQTNTDNLQQPQQLGKYILPSSYSPIYVYTCLTCARVIGKSLGSWLILRIKAIYRYMYMYMALIIVSMSDQSCTCLTFPAAAGDWQCVPSQRHVPPTPSKLLPQDLPSVLPHQTHTLQQESGLPRAASGEPNTHCPAPLCRYSCTSTDPVPHLISVVCRGSLRGGHLLPPPLIKSRPPLEIHVANIFLQLLPILYSLQSHQGDLYNFYECTVRECTIK